MTSHRLETCFQASHFAGNPVVRQASPYLFSRTSNRYSSTRVISICFDSGGLDRAACYKSQGRERLELAAMPNPSSATTEEVVSACGLACLGERLCFLHARTFLNGIDRVRSNVLQFFRLAVRPADFDFADLRFRSQSEMYAQVAL